MNNDFHAARAELISTMNARLETWEIKAKVGHGIFRNNPYDPVVRTGRALPYSALVGAAKAQPDGGVQFAREFVSWHAGEKRLRDLPEAMLALALITHWAEVGRGYHSSLSSLYGWIAEIAQAPDRRTARGLWADVNNRFPPALTYRDDAAVDFVPPPDERMDLDEPFDSGEETITAEEIAELLADAPDYPERTTRAGTAFAAATRSAPPE